MVLLDNVVTKNQRLLQSRRLRILCTADKIDGCAEASSYALLRDVLTSVE